ncbi:MAG: hypothetical protein HY744_25405, partial [Deltaproteobacteria bacterium]|nr:hypothetical protein [Deltaproteobacteria bacterium]
MRELVYVPVVHSEADLGSLSGEIRQRFEQAFGAGAWGRRRALVEAMWDGVRSRLEELPVAWSRARLYQDGLPVCGREHEIVRELAAQGSRNHQLLLDLAARGAALMGTEDPELMVREYGRVKALVRAAAEQAPDAVAQELRREGETILRARDGHMAARIDATLGPCETGILLVGLLDRIDELLAHKMRVTH